MRDARKQIIFYGTKPTRSLERFVEKHLEKRLEQESSFSRCVERCSFKVMIERDEKRPLVSCHIRVQTSSRIWEGQETGKTIQLALIQAIRRLRSSKIETAIKPTVIEHAAGAA